MPGLAGRGYLSSDLDLQPPDYGALAFDESAHAFVLAGMGVAPIFLAQQLDFYGVISAKLADSSKRCNKDEPGYDLLRMSRHHGHSNRHVQVARSTSTSAEKNDTKFTAF